ncbi:MAG: TRAP transporter substrate-binding protein DctP [Oscillospiraceae bacterium]|nr:TRAP transporter substrate-binding protein DctP [Oscillospiraceae bacterium]
MKSVKKGIAVISLALVAILLFSACGGSQSGGQTGGGQTGGATGSVWDGVDVSLQMQTHLSSIGNMTMDFPHMIQLVENVTNGAVKISAHEAGSLYAIPDALDAMQRGDLLMAYTVEGAWSDRVPVSLVSAGLPFIFSSNDQGSMFMKNRGFVDILNEAYAEYGVHYIPYHVNTQGLISKVPITDVASMQGVKLRASGSLARYLDLAGAAVTNVSASELYSAFQSGIIDGCSWGGPRPMMEMNLHEIGQYLISPDPIAGSWNSIYFSLAFWDTLTADQQNMLEAVIQLAGDQLSAATKVNNDLATAIFARRGITINHISQEAMAEFSEYGFQLLDNFAQNDEYSARAVALLKDYLAESNGDQMVLINHTYFN